MIGFLLIGLTAVYLFFGSDPSNMGNVDADKNGIWDDLDRVLEKHAKTTEQQDALRLYFIAHQEVLLNPEIGIKLRNESDTKRKQDKTFISYDCLRNAWTKNPTELDTKSIKDEMLSSRARIRAWLKFNQNLSGGFYSLWDEKKDGNSCDILRGLIDGK